MKQRDIFKKSLTKYHEYLTQRFNNGGDYIDKNNCDESSKEYIAYRNIIKELSQVELLLNFYKNE